MNCPFCESVMASGKVSVERSTFGDVMNVLGVLTGSASAQPQYLYFRQSGGGEATQVEHSREAFRCGHCQALLIAGTVATRKSRQKAPQRFRGESQPSEVVPREVSRVVEPPRELSVEEMFREALRLDQEGEWDQAAAVYDRIAEKIPDQQDGEYARTCAREMRQKRARAGGG
jgi:hypothetical protein